MRHQILNFTLPIAVVFGLTLPSQLFADPLSGEEKEGLLLELSTIQEVLSGKRVSLRTSAVQSFTTAATSDKAVYEFYLQCHKKLKFDTRDASFTEFRNWRDANEKRIKNKGNLAAMRLQLQYLVLSLRAAEGVKPEVIMPELETFVANIVNHAEELGSVGMRTIQSSVKKTIFAEAYQLDKSLEMENWSYTPGNYGSVYDKAIFPYIRTAKPETLAAAWDRRILLEKRITQTTLKSDQVAMHRFKTERLPHLNWQKSKDIYKSYSEQQGANSMLEIVKANPSHPNLKIWVDEFRILLTGESNMAKEQSTEAEIRPDKNNPLGFEKF